MASVVRVNLPQQSYEIAIALWSLGELGAQMTI